MRDKDSKALYRKWRPSVWAEVKHQDHVVRTLRNAIAKNKVGHAYIFSGPRGTGKTTAARLLAKAVNCQSQDLENKPCDQCDNCVAFNNNEFLDLIEIDAASHTGVDDARELIENVRYSPNIGPFKVYIIDEVHMLSKQAFNALLKTIEEPPEHVIFILATTELDKVMPTILSRCQRFEFKRFDLAGLVDHLNEMCEKEGIDAAPDAIAEIARFSNGGMRDAISLLDQLSNAGEKLTLEVVRNILGTATENSILEMIDAFINGNAGAAIDLVHQTMDKGANPASFTRQIVEYLRGVLLYQVDPKRITDQTADVQEKIAAHAREIPQAGLIELIRVFNDVLQNARGSLSPILALEIAVIKCVAVLNNATEPIVAVASPPVQKVVQRSPQASRLVEKPETPKGTPVVREAEPFDPVVVEDAVERPRVITPEPTPARIDPPVETAQTNQKAMGRNEIIAVWNKLVDHMNHQDRQYAALLRSARITEVKHNEVVIGFSPILKGKFDNSQLNAELQAKFQQLTHSGLTIRATVLGNKGDLPDNLSQDGMVAAAKDLGGKLVS